MPRKEYEKARKLSPTMEDGSYGSRPAAVRPLRGQQRLAPRRHDALDGAVTPNKQTSTRATAQPHPSVK